VTLSPYVVAILSLCPATDFKAVEKSIMAEITKPTKGTKYIVRFFVIFLAITLVVMLVVWLMSLLAGR
jgi:hypothetical protein